MIQFKQFIPEIKIQPNKKPTNNKELEKYIKIYFQDFLNLIDDEIYLPNNININDKDEKYLTYYNVGEESWITFHIYFHEPTQSFIDLNLSLFPIEHNEGQKFTIIFKGITLYCDYVEAIWDEEEN
jgi:hypothetical protein